MPRTTPARIPHADKPEKPFDGYPMFAHASGQWAKKINGKMNYFGVWADPDAALAKYKKEIEDRRLGVNPNREGLTVGELTTAFLESKERLHESGELAERTLTDYRKVCKRVEKQFGAGAHVESLQPVHFEKLRAALAKTHGPVTLSNDVIRVRSVFKFAFEHFDIKVKFGGFKKPRKEKLREHRKEREKRLYSAAEIQALLRIAGPAMKAMIMLGINCGLGNNDCMKLEFRHLDLKAGTLTYPRPKTSVDRFCFLWPETVKALVMAIAKRPTPKNAADAKRVFLTKGGNTWEPKANVDNPVSKEFFKLLKELGIQRDGVNFYALRHSFQTIGEKSRDKDAVKSIMGHAEKNDDMSAIYSEERPDDDRLKAVTDFVRAWLYAKPKPR